MNLAYRGRAWRCLLAAWIVAWAVFSIPWTSFTTTPRWDRFRAPYVRASSRIRLDHVLNVLFYLPAAPIAARLGLPLAAGVIGGAGLSLAAEGLQVFSSERAPNGNDIIANIAGATAGAVALALYRKRAARAMPDSVPS